MMNKMVVANLTHRPTRTVVTTSAIALEVTMILMVVALFYGLLNGSKESQVGVGADLMVMPPNSLFIGTTGVPISIKVGDVVRKVPHVTSVIPVVWAFISSPSPEVIYGIDLASYDTLNPPFRYFSGGPFHKPNDLIVDDYYAEMTHSKVGDSIHLLNHDFRICGIVPHGKGGRKFLQMSTLQDLQGAEGKVSAFYVKLDDPRNIDSVERAIQQVPGMDKYSVRSVKEWLTMMTPDNLPGFKLAIQIVIGVAVVIGFLVIFQAMYTAVMERTREIGILKSMGASKWYIMNVILRETLLIAIVGIVAGILISLVARRVIMIERPVLRLFWSSEWVLNATVIAIVGALAGALYPALKAARRDPIDALAYE